jgi:hypothetical protein
VSSASRRIKITNPVGSVTSTTFNVSQLPTFAASASTIFAGTNSGFDGNNTYTFGFQDGSLWINSNSPNMRGVRTIEFVTSAGAALATPALLTVDAAAPPAGVTFSADGTRIIIAKSVFSAAPFIAWYSPTASRKIRLTTPADTTGVTIPAGGVGTAITTAP